MSEGVTIVVPVWNRGELLRRLLASVAAQTLKPCEVIVVDNGSTDGAAEIARAWGARVIAMGRNAGFAAAVNRGIRESRGAWIALVNSDVELDANWLTTLLASLVEAGAWMGSGQTRMGSDPTLLDGTWDLMARSGCGLRAGFGLPRSDHFEVSRAVALIPATAALYRQELFERVGDFAEVYDSYLEDVDFSLRCAVAGFAAVYSPTAICTHLGSASLGAWSARMTRLISRNQILLLRRLFPRNLQKKWLPRILWGQLLWGALAARHGRLLPWLQGKLDAARMWSSVAPLNLDSFAIEEQVTRSERELYEIQRNAGFDSYWRWYFRYTGRGLK